ncbi:MAG: fatty acyl-AMP ligase [Xanthomonadaceae bacterium]|nr:fatty acyl-AMP ligase [Xanthomonadaceae bacterium]
MSYKSAIGQFQELVEKHPDRSLFTFVKDNGRDTDTLTSVQAHARAQSIAQALLNEYKLQAGDRVLLVYPAGLEFIEAFIGCLYAGIIPVPVPPPIPLRPDIGLPGFTAIATDSQAKAQLTCQSYSMGRSFGKILNFLKPKTEWPELPWIITDKINTSKDNLNSERPRVPQASDLAFLQYTSGSTRSPRGVCISYGNIWAQTQLLKNDNLMKWEGAGVFWMPHYHDFALIGGIISAMCGNYQVVLFSAAAFLRRPGMWGEILTQFKATHTGAPDFGYRLLIQKTTEEERANWDLSSLKVLMNAAEPIREKTVDILLQGLEVAKFNPKAFCPSYGLAEHTIAVSVHGTRRFTFERESLERIGHQVNPVSSRKNDGSEVTLFSTGKPCAGVSVQIVDPETGKSLPEHHVGEIWVDSWNKAMGYFGKPEESVARFEATCEGSSQKWLRTRDLGVVIDGELVITGRLDDLITIRGRNIYPQDLEGTVADADSRIRTGRVLAFGIQDKNQVYLVLELKEDEPSIELMNSVTNSARTILLQEVGLPEVTFLIVPKGTIPKTTSGKLQRNKCRLDWMNGKLPILKIDEPLSSGGEQS